ncbi:MAG: hypothetical protein JRI23_03270 [Deltaproteobacteria bacterium]|jgi:hypothetical protein|nr:hypothetical protein [Deltaproteobacteria bacterium]MBW2530530.1 hypothetical protein [Deltaproteobacteria bacterium]
MGAIDCHQTALSPEPPAAPGIALALAPRPSPASPLVVHGSFRLTPEQIEVLGGEPHRAVVLLVQHGPGHNVYVPFRDRVLFADDVTASESGVTGFFNLDVFELQGQFAAGTYHLSVSLGELISPVLETLVQ